MKVKLAVSVFIGVILVLAGSNLIKVSLSRSKAQQIIDQAQQLRELDNAEDKNTVDWRVRVAKVKGEKRVALSTGNIDYVDGVRTIDEALHHNEAIIATPIQEKSDLIENESIQTWYKFKILETLSNKDVPRCTDCVPANLVVPKEFLPISEDEILILQIGGSIVIDGVQVVMSDPKFAKLELEKRYLLLLQTDRSRKIGLLMMGPTGVYSIEDDDTLSPMNGNPHPLKSEVSHRYYSSVKAIRSHLRSKLN